MHSIREGGGKWISSLVEEYSNLIWKDENAYLVTCILNSIKNFCNYLLIHDY